MKGLVNVTALEMFIIFSNRLHEVWRSVVTDSAENFLIIQPPHFVVYVAYHFTTVIIPLTVDCGIFSSKETLQLDLQRWHPIMFPCWNSLSS